MREISPPLSARLRWNYREVYFHTIVNRRSHRKAGWVSADKPFLCDFDNEFREIFLQRVIRVSSSGINRKAPISTQSTFRQHYTVGTPREQNFCYETRFWGKENAPCVACVPRRLIICFCSRQSPTSILISGKKNRDTFLSGRPGPHLVFDFRKKIRFISFCHYSLHSLYSTAVKMNRVDPNPDPNLPLLFPDLCCAFISYLSESGGADTLSRIERGTYTFPEETGVSSEARDFVSRVSWFTGTWYISTTVMLYQLQIQTYSSRVTYLLLCTEYVDGFNSTLIKRIWPLQWTSLLCMWP